MHRFTFITILLLIAVSSQLLRPSIATEIPIKAELLWPQGAPGAIGTAAKDKPKLIIHRLQTKTPTAAVVICPGGGYGHLAMDHEGKSIAKWFNSLGVQAFVLDYRHRGKGYGHPAPMQDAQRAIRFVRAKAKELNIDSSKIGVIGFSAGGHLASTVATHFDAGNKESKDPIERVSCRPDFAILCYPVIQFGQKTTHLGSQRNLLGKNPNVKLLESLSNEKQVTKETPPTFLFHTNADRGVLAENSIAFYLALRKHRVPAELHIYEKGRHGLGLAKKVPGSASWPTQCVHWLQGRKVISERPVFSTQ